MKQLTAITNRLFGLRSSLWGQLTRLKLPLLWPGYARKSESNWIIKKGFIKIWPHQYISFTLRKFRSHKRTDFTKRFQIIIPLHILSVREFVIARLKVPSASVKRSVRLPALVRQIDFSMVLIIFGVGGAIFFGTNGLQNKKIEPDTTFSIPVAATPTPVSPAAPRTIALTKSEPTHLKIESVGIDAPIDPVGKQADGTMETPPLFANLTGWYKFSPTPGEMGPSIIVGHIDTYKGPSVFYKLKDLKAGDMISVTRQDGKSVKFQVNGLEQFDQNNFPTEKVYGNIQHAGLRLITCGGTYDKKSQKYSHNTVVFATMVP